MIVLLIILFLGLSVFSYYRTQKMNLAFINSTLWGSLALLNTFLGLPQNTEAYFFILFNCFIIAVFHTMAFHGNKGNAEIMEVDNADDQSRFEKANKIIALLGLLGLIYLAVSLNFGLSTFTSMSSLMTKMNSISHMRYSNEDTPLSVLNRIINSFGYAACGLSGFYLIKKMKVEYLYNFMIFLGQTIILNTKATLVFAVTFMLSGYLTGLLYYGKKINVKKVLIGIAMLMAGLVFFSCIQYLRHRGMKSFDQEFNSIIVSYFVGPFSAFCIWFEKYTGSPIEFGTNTLSAVFRLPGISSQSHGDFVYITDSITTNVYTLYKHLVNDYALLGTVCISAFIGVISGMVDIACINKRKSAVGISIIISTFIITGFFSSLFRYTTNVLACVILILLTSSIRIKRIGI